MARQTPMELSTQVESALLNILDTMTGADGGTGFMALRGLLEALERQASSGDAAAKQILLSVVQFSRLIDIARRQAGLEDG